MLQRRGGEERNKKATLLRASMRKSLEGIGGAARRPGYLSVYICHSKPTCNIDQARACVCSLHVRVGICVSAACSSLSTVGISSLADVSSPLEASSVGCGALGGTFLQRPNANTNQKTQALTSSGTETQS